ITFRGRGLYFQGLFSCVGLASCFRFVSVRLPGFRALAAVLARSALHSAQRAVIRSLRALRPAAEMRDFLPTLRVRTWRRLLAGRSSLRSVAISTSIATFLDSRASMASSIRRSGIGQVLSD